MAVFCDFGDCFFLFWLGSGVFVYGKHTNNENRRYSRRQVFFLVRVQLCFFWDQLGFSDVSKLLDFDREFCYMMEIKSKKKKKVIYCNLRQCNWVFHQCVKSLIKKKNLAEDINKNSNIILF